MAHHIRTGKSSRDRMLCPKFCIMRNTDYATCDAMIEVATSFALYSDRLTFSL